MKPWIPILAAGAMALVAPLQAQDATADPLEQSVLALEDEYDEAYADWREELMARSAAYREARKENPDAVYERLAPIEPDFFPRFDEAAAAGSVRAQVWCVVHYTPGESLSKAAQRADFTRRVLAVLADPAADHSKLPRAIMGKSRGPLGPESADALMVVLQQVAKPEVAAEAAYFRVSMKEVRGGTEEQQKATLTSYRKVAKAYSGTKWGGRAGGKVFKAEKLQMGMVAPEILGKDVDGNDMKLTDFRGKVTVIDFWGFW